MYKIYGLAHLHSTALAGVARLQLHLLQENQAHHDLIMNLRHPTLGAEVLPRNIAIALRSLIYDPAVSEFLHRANESQFKTSDVESAGYFFDSIDRIVDPEYLPIDEDILRAQKSSLVQGNWPTIFTVGEMSFRFCDMSGQWHGRRKWLHHFEGMQAVLFLVDLNRYDHKLDEQTGVR